ncbi:DUF262 domain-containing protein [Mitsuokella sp. AF33-22]|uniref:DUF262 domain-containing protein n=1 Tax=Mitsuokella sp. AF33-22 TaxID=2292047 RepID=UPI000E4B3127|nr:DUF262 domain-containing protein [Mitsuokella sp. AF33-22]RHM54212.1 DUF262 domain-containing protein [Mitsuokella sp. AF33-22]
MSKLNIDQKSVRTLFSEKKTDFLIPDYQRPYAWGEKECQTLWDDLFFFSFPDNNCDKFDSDTDEYFLGPIVTFKNEDGKMEIIDGQQRLTTLMLLLRAFYDKYGSMKNDRALKTSKFIEQCIWKTDEFGDPDKSALKIDSEVATDEQKNEFLNILKTGIVQKDWKSNYAMNYQFFQMKIADFLNAYPDWFSYFPIRIMNNCILLPIEAESQDTALRIFSTLNDRGKPLSDADIFKAQFYKYFSSKGEKDQFIQRWKDLEVLCESIFHPITGTPMDELFTRYMYYERAKQGIKTSTTEALRTFYERDSYALLKCEQTFENLIDLANFWNDVQDQSKARFSDQVLRRLFVLNYAPNGMWTYFVSVYYMTYRDSDGMLEDESFYRFLNKITAFIWAYAVTNPGVNALRTPVFAEMVNVVKKLPIKFDEYLFQAQHLQSVLNNYAFSNNRAITKSMLTWWACQDEGQELPALETSFQIEHIFARNRQAKEGCLSNPRNLESLGNKALLEKRINIRASDYRFADKKKYYTSFINSRNQKVYGTNIKELLDLANKQTDFTETDIVQRNAKIMLHFQEYLKENDLLRDE